MVSALPPEKKCVRRFSNTFRWTIISLVVIVLQMDASVQKRLRNKKPLKKVSVVAGQDQIYHIFDFEKYTHRYLGEYQHRLKHRFDLAAMLPRLLNAITSTEASTGKLVTIRGVLDRFRFIYDKRLLRITIRLF